MSTFIKYYNKIDLSRVTSLIILNVVVFYSPSVFAQIGGGYNLEWNTIENGGEMVSSGGGYEVAGTMGQKDTGIITGGDYKIDGGFWPGSSSIDAPTAPLPDPYSPGTLACGPGDGSPGGSPNYGQPCEICDAGARAGLPCMDSFGCPSGSCVTNHAVCAPATCGGGGTTFCYPKSRFIAFATPSDSTWVGQDVAIRVSLNNIVPDAACNGEIRWAGAPAQYCEGSACSTLFWASQLQSTPHWMDWTTVGTVQLYGEEVVSDSRYVIQAVDISSAGDLTNEDNYSVPGLIVDTAKWGDVDIPLAGFTTATQPSIADVLKLVDKWLGNLEPRKSRTQLQPAVINPTSSVGIADVLKGVDAWLGTPYPYSITTCP